MMLPKKVTFTAPSVWTPVHQLRTSAPPAELAALQQWIHLQHVPSTYDLRVSDALDRVIDEHQGTTESWLAITGERHLGKTNATTAVMIERALSGPIGWQSKQPTGFRNVPFVFIEASSNPSATQVMKAACRFLGLPTNGDENDLFERLSQALPEMGVQAIVVDEAQNFRRRTARASKIADGLRRLLHLPVPLVYSGLDLRASALMKQFDEEGDPSDQLIERSIVLDLTPLGDAEGLREIKRIVRAFTDRLALIPDFDPAALRDNDAMRALIADKKGRPGSIIEAIKKSATSAVKTEDRVLTPQLLLGRESLDLEQAA